MPLTKLTVKIYTPLLRHFDEQLARLHIKRDAFLESMIRTETPNLVADLQGKRLSGKARRYISGELKRLGTTPVNVQVQKSTADLINQVVADANIVRDAFVNRLIMFLRSSDQVLRYLDLPLRITYSDYKSWVEPMPTSPLQAMESIYLDPLFYLRTAIEERHETGLYMLELPPKFAGFSCYLADSQVPGTPEFAEAQRLADEALDDLLNLTETEAFAKPLSPGSQP